MAAKVFFDANVLVYAAAGSGPDEAKRRRSMELIETQDFATSAQVLQEFFCDGGEEGAGPSFRE